MSSTSDIIPGFTVSSFRRLAALYLSCFLVLLPMVPLVAQMQWSSALQTNSLQKYVPLALTALTKPHHSLPHSHPKLLTQFNMDVWTTDRGLPNNTILHLYQSHDGYLWCATNGGLVRFDGTRFTLYNSVNTPAIKNNRIMNICEDHMGAYWFGTNGAGIVRMQGNTFTRITKDNGLMDNIIWSLYEDSEKFLWVGTAKGLSRLRLGATPTARDTLSAHWQAEAYPFQNVLGTYRVNCINQDAAGNRWFGTYSHGLFKITPRGELVRFSIEQGLPNLAVNDICEDTNNGGVWIATSGGICKVLPNDSICTYKNLEALSKTLVWELEYDAKSDVLWAGSSNGLHRINDAATTQIPEALTVAEGLPDIEVSALTLDAQGNVWAGTYRGGMARVYEGSVTTITEREGLTGNVTYSVLEDTNGEIWVGTYGGVSRLRPNGTILRTYRIPSSLQGDKRTVDNLSVANLVRSLCKDRDGSLWVGTYGHGLYQWSNLDAAKPTLKQFSVQEGLGASLIRALFQDSRGTLWIGASTGLYRMDRDAATGKPQFTSYTKRDGLLDDSILGITEDKHGNMWFFFDSGGMTCFANGTFTPYTPSDGLAGPVVFTMHEERDGTYWFGTQAGLSRWKKGIWKTIAAKDGLPDDSIFHILEDENGNFWCGTSLGIFRIAKQSLHDFADGRAAQLHPTLYTKSDGLKSPATNVPARACRTRDGRLWFPSHKGVSVIAPMNMSNRGSAPVVHVERIVADEREVQFNQQLNTQFSTLGAEQIGAEHNDSLQSIMLAAGTKQVEVHYSTPVFTAPETIRFRCMLEGFNRSWVEAGTRRAAFYTNLPPGEYILRVAACNRDGEWSNTPTSLRIVIQPFFYQRTSFFVLCSVVSICAVFAGVWLRVRSVERRARRERIRLETLVAERTAALESSNIELTEANQEIQRQNQILGQQAVEIEVVNAELHEQNLLLGELNRDKDEMLSIVAHDLKNPLSAIKMSASMMLNYRDKIPAEQATQRVQNIVALSERMSSIITNLLDLNAIESGAINITVESLDVVPLVASVVADYRERAVSKSITIHFEQPPPESASILALADQNALLQVLDNLVSNAVKYSLPEKTIWVEVTRQNEQQHGVQLDKQNAPAATNPVASVADRCFILVKDEGPGISDADKTHLFSKFTRLSAKPTGGEHSTGLGLSIVKRLVEAMNGTVLCHSILGEGSTFVVSLNTPQRE